ncbi:hypothetical protein [Sphingopyxis macrogoltabida]|uniref:PIN domain-containing protein n=1 Tax=Sphingopyxis macrogoltabida TaxID=33050 RepID=A0AAC9AU86_SPHMC|nr:hypothetical protein [Sphingopyxis macrogoltabida]ALJ11931.1 hypothetical protein LH19_03525 [Sphingopyxis macrogoltabida]AMU88114.1 hypothetical protein ATM17_03490 [Sphingopyxis macrogoltabida]
MAEPVLLDNDVVLKACAYQSHAEALARTTIDELPPGILKIARYTLQAVIARASNLVDRESAARALDIFLNEAMLLEPSDGEIELAADLEERAAAASLEFDTGESQLVAIMISRGCPLLVTGDKRAIIALSGILLAEAHGRVACFEQFMMLLTAMIPHDELRRRVCSEPGADKAIANCFSCSAPAIGLEDILNGLLSYSEHLRGASGEVLIADDRLLAIVS